MRGSQKSGDGAKIARKFWLGLCILNVKLKRYLLIGSCANKPSNYGLMNLMSLQNTDCIMKATRFRLFFVPERKKTSSSLIAAKYVTFVSNARH